jgi:2-polyprenyl-3-methyl-5-hydroxy-6-metoxy-1,4-benzoquinol methylase
LVALITRVDGEWEYVACILCGADEPRQLLIDRVCHRGEWLEFRIASCCRCGLVYTNPRHRGDASRGYHGPVTDDLERYLSERRWPIHHRGLAGIQKRLQPERGLQPGRLLDIGCATGAFLRLAQRHGFEAVGIELSPTLAAHARERGLEVHQGRLEELGLPDRSFDVVTMWDVVEHLDSPLDTLRHAHRVLAHEGVLALRTGNSDFQIPKARLLRLLRPDWGSFLSPNQHIYHFSPRTVKSMLVSAGFVTVEVEDSATEIYIQTLKHRLMRAYNALASVAGRPIGRVMTNAMDVYGRRR